MYRSSGDLVKAEENFKQVVSINPKNIVALNRLSEIYSTWEEYDKALDEMKKLIKVQPDITDIYYNIACIYAKQNNINESLSWMKKAVSTGFHNWALIQKDPDLEPIRNTAYINKLLLDLE